MDLKNDFLIDELQRIGKVGIFSYDVKDKTVAASEIVYELFGADEKKVRSSIDWLNFIHPSQRTELILYFKEIIETGKDFDKEVKIVYEKNETEKWMVIKGKVFLNGDNIPEKLSGTVHDISELKNSEEKYKKLCLEFQEKEALLSSLINSIPDLIFYKDINGKYLGCNKAYEKFIGMKEKDIRGRTDVEFLNKEIAKSVEKNEKLMIEKEEHCMYEEWAKYPNGKGVLLDTLKSPYYDSNRNVLGIIGVSRDITERSNRDELKKGMEEERRRLKELKETERIRTEFFTNVSHELRTPINVIFSALQMEELMVKNLSGDNLSDDKFKYVNMMKQNCYRLLRLIENLIDITKFENGYFNINEANNDIISLVENVVLSVASYTENKNVSIIFDTSVEEKIIAFDAEKMERIILNLLSNAVKFTSRGGTINVIIEEENDEVCIRVKDNGKGIPAEKLNSIFERFVQIDNEQIGNHEGSGIGLSIVKSLVEQHRGRISVKSIVGKGSEFIIHIPCRLIKDEVSCKITDFAHLNKSNIERVNIEFANV